MSSSPSHTQTPESWSGTILICFSTTFYGISSVVQRLVSEMQIVGTQEKMPIDWILFYKELVGASVLVPWLLFRLFQGRHRHVSKRLLFFLVIAAIICQLIGARLHLYGIATIGLVIAIPLVQSSTLIGTALLGQVFLGDALSKSRMVSIFILIASLCFLTFGKLMLPETSDNAVGTNLPYKYVMLVALGAIVAGIAYSFYVIMIRWIGRQHYRSQDGIWASFQYSQWVGHDFPTSTAKSKRYAPLSTTLMMFIVLGTGAVIFGICLFLNGRCRFDAFYAGIPQSAWNVIAISGLANVIGFFFQIQGLRMTTAIQASLIAVSQIVALSLIGIFFFGEQTNTIVWVGLGLTAYGIVRSANPENKRSG